MSNDGKESTRTRRAIVTSADPNCRFMCMCPATEHIAEDGKTVTIVVDLDRFPANLRSGAWIQLVDAQFNWDAFQARQNARAYGTLTYVSRGDGRLAHITGTLCPSNFDVNICLHSAQGDNFSGVTFAEIIDWRELTPPPGRIIVEV